MSEQDGSRGGLHVLSDEDKRGKDTWDSSAYVFDPYLGLARPQGADARKTGEDSRCPPGQTEATLLPKRSRKATRPTACQVDGCGRDLSGEKAYLQRYLVCESHFKADVALVHGQEMRFCQQCNKFQDLREFEGVRRSCAARSKDRNLRRRLQTTLQKGGTLEEAGAANTVATNVAASQRQQQQQQSGSPGRSGAQTGGAPGASADSGGRAGASGDGSMGGSAALAGGPGGGGGGSDDSLGAAGAADPTAAARSTYRGQTALGDAIYSRTPAAPLAVNAQLLVQPTGSGGNAGGSSSGNPDGGAQDPRIIAAGPWGSMEQMGQSYEADAGLPPSLMAAMGQGGAAAIAADGGDGGGCMPMELDGFPPATSAEPFRLAHASRHQQSAGNTAAALTLDAGGGPSAAVPAAVSQRDKDAEFLRKLAAVAGGDSGSSWGGPSAQSLWDALDSIRPQQQAQQQQHQQHPLQQGQQSVLPRPGLQQGLHHSGSYSSGSLLGGVWGSGVSHQQPVSLIAGGNGLAGQDHQQQQVTLGGLGDDGSAAALLEQLQGPVAASGVEPRGALGLSAAAAQDDLSLASLLGQGGPRVGGVGLGPNFRNDQFEGPCGASNGHAGRALMQQSQPQQQQPQQQQAAGAFSSLRSGPSSQRQDDLTAMIKERRAALIRQQLLQQYQRQQQQEQAHEPLLPGEQLVRLGSAYSEGPSTSIAASEQLRLRLLAASARGSSGAAGSAATAALDDHYDVAPALGGRGGDGGGGRPLNPNAGRLIGAGNVGAAPSAGGLEVLTGMLGRQQIAADVGLDTVQLLEQYALGGGNSGGNGGHAEFGAGLGSRANAGGGRSGRYDGMGGIGGAGFAGRGDGGHRGNDHDGEAGGGGRSVLSVLFPGAGGREDALAARVCLKLFSCMPEDLPADMLIRLRRWAGAAESDVMQIFMRPGCVHLIVNVRLSRGSQETLYRYVLGGGDLLAAVAALRAAFESSGLLRGRRVVVQAAEGPRGAFEYDGTAGGQACWVADADLARAPSVVAMDPAVLPAGAPTVVALMGRNLLRPGTRYHVRCGSRSYELRPLVPPPIAAAGTTSTTTATVRAQSPPGVPAAAANDGADPRLCSTDASPAPLWPEAAHGSNSSPPASPLIVSGGCADALPPHDVPDQVPGSWTSSGSSRGVNGAARAPAITLLADGAAAEPLVPTAALQAGTCTAEEAGLQLCPWGAKAKAVCSLEVVYVQLPSMPRHGLVAVEATCSEADVMGDWAPGLVCQDPAAAAELNAWLKSGVDGASGRWLLKELGLLLDYDAMLPTLLQEPTLAAAAASSAGRRSEVPTAAPPGAGGLPGSVDRSSSAGSGSAASVRGSHQRALQQKQALQNLQQAQPQQRAAEAMSSPLPRHAAGHGSIAVAAAGLATGALSALPYGPAESSSLSDLHSAGPDGSAEQRSLPSEGLVPGAAAAAVGAPHAQPSRTTLSDDTKVPDNPGRLLGPSMRRVLSHPLLNAGCWRTMRTAGARLLAFSVASGLSCLATSLLEWLMVLEGLSLGISTSAVAAAGPAGNLQDSEPVPDSAAADLFSRVAARAATTTLRGAAAGAGMGAGAWSAFTGELYLSGDSSLDSSIGDSSMSSVARFRKLGTGLSLLHLAVASCNSRMVMRVLDWAEEYGRPWPLDERCWSGRVTPLHLAAAAAALRGGGDEAARLLLSLGPEAQEAWLQARDAGGRTPADIAHSAGLDLLNYLCIYGEEEPAEEEQQQPRPLSAAANPNKFLSEGIGAAGAVTPAAGAGALCGSGRNAGFAAAGDAQRPAVAVVPRRFGSVGLSLLLGSLLVVLLAAAMRGL